MQNTTITYYQWPIGCSLYLEQINATVRGDNQLVASNHNPPPISTVMPFVRSKPVTVLERVFARIVDTVWSMESSPHHYGITGQFLPSYWLEQKLMTLLNQKNLSSSSRLDTLETMLQNLTSTAYALLIHSIRTGSEANESGSETKLAYVSVLGRQDDAVFAKLQVHGLPVMIGLVCVLVLAGCTMASTRPDHPFGARDDGVLLAAGVMDIMYLMHESGLPGALTPSPSDLTEDDQRRSKAERLDVMYSDSRLDLSDRIVEQPVCNV